MRIRGTFLCCITALLAVVLAGLEPAAAYDYAEGDSYTGVKVGMLGAGEVDLTGETADQKAGFGAGVFFDFPAGTHLHYGASVDLFSVHWKANTDTYSFDATELMMDIGINVKAMLGRENGSFALRPGLGIGFGVLRRMADFNGSNYLTLKAFAEMVYFTPGTIALLLDSGVWYAPSGGDNDHDIKIGPLFYLRAGVMF